ncbi:telomere repeat binding factor-domain-containing protein [Myxozyma melibiosi]|uniref:Telomere repeat binding factor-domain-containing protein n=1 Tax=Myxozyma melibiosi TaxID=54550 RepID=A0ABR1FE94_9ASCO
MITAEIEGLDPHPSEEANAPQSPRGEKRGHDENMFQMNDAEQLRFIADQLESVQGHDGAAFDDLGALDHHDHHEPQHQQHHQQHYQLQTVFDYPLDELTGSNDPSMQLKMQSMPILDNLSNQILATLGRGAYESAYTVVTQPESDQGQAFRTLNSLFEQTKRLYTTDFFLSATALGLSKSPRYCSTIRKANLATFVTAVYGICPAGFFHLDKYFIDSFVPENSRLLKVQGALYLDLKTQSFISGLGQKERTREQLLDDLFPDELERIFLDRRPGAGKVLSAGELDFIARCKSRKEILANPADDEALSEKYPWTNFVRDINDYVAKNYASIIALPGPSSKKQKRLGSMSLGSDGTVSGGAPDMDSVDVNPYGEEAAVVHAEPVIPNLSSMQHHVDADIPVDPSMHLGSSVGQAGSVNVNGSGEGILSAEEAYAAANEIISGTRVHDGEHSEGILASTGNGQRSKPPRNRASNGGANKRRPWSKEEETALLEGLEKVQGPKWSAILEMYGPGGTVSEVLKDRNQVQLKDKARNMKLYCLKNGMEVPLYLSFVTGELKDRHRKSGRTDDD